jgi:hypothetical protein
MKKETITRIKLTAAEGKTLTNGETFGKEVYLGNGDSPDNWTEIIDAEAKKIQEERDAEAQTAV